MMILSFEHVTLGYDGNTILREISFSVDTGEYLGIVGENGSGKSTLLKSIVGLLKPKSGSIYLDKTKKIGYLPQQTIVQRDFPASVWEVVRSGRVRELGWNPFYGKKDTALAKQALEWMRIETLKNQSYRELSGGQQQRVLLARALCAAENLLVLDEPIAGLDPKAAEELYALILQLNREHNMTIIMVSHDLDAVLRDCTKVLDIQNESAILCTPAQYMQHKHRE